jgi:hypothetical protein
MLMSFPALVAMSSGQWAPLVMCAALGSAYGWTAALKPTLGIAMLARRVDWRGAALAAVVGLLSLVVLPTWPAQWAATIWSFSGAKIHHIPVTVPGGVLLLLAALRWRTADGRLLLAMAVMPQSMFFYDQLALGLLARSFRQVLLCSLWSYVVMGAAYLAAPPNLDTLAQNAGFLSRAIVWGYYLPALVVVLRRPNVPARPSTAGS